ncbi:RVT_1 domain-containing protein/Telomerase_RBD domain-containing protein [Cephalotus follicularis]|uniref:Telomerase reverse transcriptase n=1 Tax=Cephalotus follicularis TaxID=3775 RepID=A0A1Q3BGF9_CEPFO|nr:RVT_1 domain-containing protein/Telomerase_RBD domain-containing protein [Cephalotus follicularis]
MPKQRRVPEVLWRLFRDKAQTLAHAIISLIPQQSAENCRCKGRRCLQCDGPDALSFLLRPDDPSGYRNLLNRCFVVVDPNALCVPEFTPGSRWSQHQIVERTIEMILCEQSKTSNVLCNGFDRCNHSSPIVELLTSSAWDILLKRVGDNIMVYLLRCTSIFLPLPHKKHHQVAGPPIIDLCYKFLKHKAQFEKHCASVVQTGHQKKRKRDDTVTSEFQRPQLASSFCVDGPLSSGSCVGCNGGGHLRSSIKLPGNSCGFKSFSEVITLNTGAGELQQNSNQVTAKVRKRSRPFSWQRRKKHRQIIFQESRDKICCTTVFTDADLPGRLECGNEKMSGQYSCCLRLQARNLVNQVAQINRQSIFYNLEHSSSALPLTHVLYSCKPGFAGANFLICKFFGLSNARVSTQSIPCFHSSGFGIVESACLYHSLVKLVKVIIHRAQSCQHLRLLDKHCSVSSSDQKAISNSSSVFEDNNMGEKVPCNTLEAGALHFEAVKHFCLKSQVVSFIWAVCRNIVPSDMLGTPSNWRILRRNIFKFLCLRRFEKFSLRQCMHKLKTSRFPFLSDKHFSCYLNTQGLNYATENSINMQKNYSNLNDAIQNLKLKILENWIYWFFSSLVVPLVQANFFVTESEHGKQDIYYYRKSSWQNLIDRAITYLKDEHFCHLDDVTTRRIIYKRPFGFSKLRLLPKENGVRLLANLKASSKLLAKTSSLRDLCSGMKKNAQVSCKTVQFRHFKSVNNVLRDTYAVLKGLQRKEPDILGSSVFDYNDVYRKLCPFLVSLKNGATTMPYVYIVVSDVSKAFDSIDQDKLLSVMKEVILKDEYLLEKSYQVVCTNKSLWVHENITSMDQDIGIRSFRGILVNKGWSRYVNKEELFFNLNEHVKLNVLQLDKKFYLQGKGISQGSILSSLLCSLYYGHLDRNVIYPFLETTCEAVSVDVTGRHNFCEAFAAESTWDNTIISSPSYMLLRFIDDFIFLSTSRKQAASFFYRLQRGFQDYNCYMNKRKFCLNFDIGQKSGLPSNRMCVGEDGISFLRWSGLLINCCTLEVQGDYTRYLNNHLSSTLTVCWHCKPAHHLKAKLCGFMRPKCHPIFFDSNINSEAVVRLNIYQAFLLCAMKFHCYVTDLSYICKLSASSYLKIIERSLRYMQLLIKKRMRSLFLGDNLRPVLQLGEGEVKWLGLNAYIEVLKRKQSRYKELLSLLRSKLLAHRISGSPSCQLKYAVDRSHSSFIWKIKY